VDEADGGSLFRGYRICAFPDAMDRQTPEIGYMPGQLPWFFGERLAQQGVQIVNDGIDGSVLQDRLLLTGDSPLAGNALGKLAAHAARRPGRALTRMSELVQALLELERARSLSAVGAYCAAFCTTRLRPRAGVRHRHGLERGTQRVYWIEGDWFGDGSVPTSRATCTPARSIATYWTVTRRSSGASARVFAANAIRW
jgi:hypothetical protein